jgi:hypothetical protein
VIQTLRANDIAYGMDVSTGKLRKNPEWLRQCHPLMSDEEIMSALADERLVEMESEAMQKVINNVHS